MMMNGWNCVSQSTESIYPHTIIHGPALLRFIILYFSVESRDTRATHLDTRRSHVGEGTKVCIFLVINTVGLDKAARGTTRYHTTHNTTTDTTLIPHDT